MNYFEVQHRLNQQTRYLYFLFLMMIGVALFVVNYFVSSYEVFINAGNQIRFVKLAHFQWYTTLSAGASGLILLIIIINYINTRINLSSGFVVAQNLGGVEVTGNHQSPYYRVLNQVVNEMAIAAGIPAPRVFVLDGQTEINAFAAGFSAKDSVIAVTEGALHVLTRSELQALVAHEMSHVVNQDMRLNMHLIAVLAGFMSITSLGFLMIRSVRFSSVSSEKKDARILLVYIALGCALVVGGYFLYILGRMIQSWISVKREYYADSHAVSSLRDARPMMRLLLKLSQKIKSDPEEIRLSALNVPEYQHFLFSSVRYFSFFKTHPPLKNRIVAIRNMMSDVQANTPLSELTISEQVRSEMTVSTAVEPGTRVAMSESDPSSGQWMSPGTMLLAPMQEMQAVETPIEARSLETATAVLAGISVELQRYINDKDKLEIIYYAFFLDSNEGIRNVQRMIFNDRFYKEIIDVRALIDQADIRYVYIIAELTYPLFHQLTYAERHQVLSTIRQMMIKAQTTIQQHCLYYSLNKLIGHSANKRVDLLRKRPNCTFHHAGVLEHIYFILSVIAQKASHYDDPKLRAEHFREAMITLYPKATRSMLQLEENDSQWAAKFNEALSAIDQLDAVSKTRLMNTLLIFINLDNRVTTSEYELIRFISLCIEYPLPLELPLS